MAEKYFMLESREQETDIIIYGDITSWEWLESDVSSYSLAKAIEGITSPVINVYINSYGGEIAEGVAIHRQLRRHAAHVRTYCDGFACSAASLVFVAGNERNVYPTSMLMVHNGLYEHVSGNAAELRKHADTIEMISQTAANAYMDVVSIDRETLDLLLANETWIPPQMAVDMGFATQIIEEKTVGAKATLSARKSVFDMICSAQSVKKDTETLSSVEPAAPDAATGDIKGQAYASGSDILALNSGTVAASMENGEVVLPGVPFKATIEHVPPQKPPEDRFLKMLQAAVNKQFNGKSSNFQAQTAQKGTKL